jgi:hypothetical protein
VKKSTLYTLVIVIMMKKMDGPLTEVYVWRVSNIGKCGDLCNCHHRNGPQNCPT